MPESGIYPEGFPNPLDDYVEDLEPDSDEYLIHKSGPSDLSLSLAGTFDERLQILRDAIEDIDSEIGLRLELSKSLEKSMAASREEILWLLRQMKHWQLGAMPSMDFRRTSLEREIIGLYREGRAEKQRAFSDIISLRKERRKLLIEYKSLKATSKMLAP